MKKRAAQKSFAAPLLRWRAVDCRDAPAAAVLPAARAKAQKKVLSKALLQDCACVGHVCAKQGSTPSHETHDVEAVALLPWGHSRCQNGPVCACGWVGV